MTISSLYLVQTQRRIKKKVKEFSALSTVEDRTQHILKVSLFRVLVWLMASVILVISFLDNDLVNYSELSVALFVFLLPSLAMLDPLIYLYSVQMTKTRARKRDALMSRLKRQIQAGNKHPEAQSKVVKTMSKEDIKALVWHWLDVKIISLNDL